MSAPNFPPLIRYTAPIVALPASGIDTDQLFPARFMTTTSRAGLGELLFHDWRHDAAGAKTSHRLNRMPPGGPAILVAGANFGCGSSREHAVWALADFGARVVISSVIAEIFAGNAVRNGVLPIVVEEAVVQRLMACDGGDLTVDLEHQRLTTPGLEDMPFAVDGFARRCLMEGVDALSWLLGQAQDIDAFERDRRNGRGGGGGC
ncbi:3-isopropylmalate dehydratase, small subunit [Caulobacter sp. AP07]|uniref:3-isopropylmalate dehydratase small subunit n=1 Tax=Caulobacter sp. AP07 TaxID=1144304 RepID=UPI0002720726|nr:3-isopropylmalate dehydratase small subunit [Caulobacter sp. AP07]EJL27305.1 3-isopropylmalate dehydratase, small subunit [Caulobacter sp. AP07]